VTQKLTTIKTQIQRAEQEAGRKAGSTTLVAVSKVHNADTIRPVLDAGHKVFGENRVQEAQRKWPALKADYPDVQLHLIGPLQTNKVKDAVALFDVIETLDRPKLAHALARQFTAQGLHRPCFIQVNIGAEPQKSGILPEQLPAFLTLCRDELALPIIGLMCIPPQGQDPRPYFALLQKLATENDLGQLSMGMSADFPVAIAEGATHIRVGTALFGQRPAKT